MVVWYYGPGPLTNIPDEKPGQPSINTYSTYRRLYNTKDGNIIPNSGINFSETYVEDDLLKNATIGQENYSTFTINLGYKSVSGTLYGLADKDGYWPENSIVLGTIPNKSVFAGSVKNDDLLPYNFIRFNTYPIGLRSVHLSVNEIRKDDPIPGPELGDICISDIFSGDDIACDGGLL